MFDPPDKIYLQIEEGSYKLLNGADATWCEDQIYESDVVYVRLDSKSFAAAMDCPECLAALAGLAEPVDVFGMYGTVHLQDDRSFIPCAAADIWEADKP